MPRHFLPKNSGRHRIACIALYRALLLQCSRIELPPRFRGPVNPLKLQIRKQFDRNIHEVSAPLVVKALKIGYEAEELLYSAANGDEASKSKILALIDEIQPKSSTSPAIPAIHRRPPVPPRKPELYPLAPRVLDVRPRPLSQLSSGRRHLPVLVNANGLPFLRFKKPQSPFLSRVLRDKIAQKQRLLDGVDDMQKGVAWAEDEQRWEGIVEAGNGLANGQTTKDAKYENKSYDTHKNASEGTWDKDMRIVKRGLQHDIRAWDARAQAISHKMLKIVDEERALFEEERRARKQERYRLRRERRDARPAGNAAESSADAGSGPGSGSSAGAGVQGVGDGGGK